MRFYYDCKTFETSPAPVGNPVKLLIIPQRKKGYQKSDSHWKNPRKKKERKPKKKNVWVDDQTPEEWEKRQIWEDKIFR